MSIKIDSKFEKFLNVISSISTYKILKLIADSNKGFSLSETAKVLNLSISTVNDNLKKLLKSHFIYSVDKEYFISSYGYYIFNKLEKLELFNKLNPIIGKIPKDIIPNEFFEELLPVIEDIKVKTRSLNVILDMNRYAKIFKSNLQNLTESSVFKTLGWWSDDIEFTLIRDYLSEWDEDPVKIREMVKNLNIEIITDENFVNKIIENKKVEALEEYLDLNQAIRIIEENIKFNFTIIKINQHMILFLIKDNDEIDIKHHLFIENQNIDKFFNRLFNYYRTKSVSLKEFLKKRN